MAKINDTPGFPLCATACFEALSPGHPMDVCQADRNASLVQAAETCLLGVCSPRDTLDTLASVAQACRWAVRSRRANLLALFAIQAPALVCLVLRLYGRLTRAARLAMDDYLAIATLPLFVVFLALGQYAAAIAFGVDIWTVPPDTIVEGMRAFYVDEMLYLAILALVKLSILFLYLRLFVPQAPASTSPAARRYRCYYRHFRTAVLVVAIFVVVPSIVFVLLDAFQCRPVDVVWTRWVSTTPLPPQDAQTGTDVPRHVACLDVRTLAYTAASFGIAQEMAILLAPWPLLLLLRRSLSTTSTATTATALAMFSLGVFVVATSCIRLHFLVHFDSAQSANPTWDNTDSLIWSGLEVSVSVIVTSLPTARAVVQPAWRDFWATRARR